MSDQQAYDLETILRELRDVIDTARTMPMSASVLVNREETLELIDDAGSMTRSCASALLLKERDDICAGALRPEESRGWTQARAQVESNEVAREAAAVPRRDLAGRSRSRRCDTRRGLHRPEARRVEVVLERTWHGVRGADSCRRWWNLAARAADTTRLEPCTTRRFRGLDRRR